jgi:hypothetical protein
MFQLPICVAAGKLAAIAQMQTCLRHKAARAFQAMARELETRLSLVTKLQFEAPHATCNFKVALAEISCRCIFAARHDAH